MLEAITGIATAALLVTGGVVGVRLLRRSEPSAPEWKLGLFFLLYTCIGSAFNCVAYAGWASPQMGIPPSAIRLCAGVFFWVGGAGLVALLAFVRQTFRPDARPATWLAAGIALALLVSSIAAGVTEGYEVRVLNGWGYWLNFAARDLVFVWIAFESLRYWAVLRRRLALGLAEPVVVNRFLLIGVWALSLALLTLSDPVARVRYYLLTGSTVEWVPEIGRPLLLTGMATAAGLLAVAVCALLLAFFPTRGFRRYLEGAVAR